MKSLCKSILLLAVVFSATPLFARMPGPFPGEEHWKLQEEAVSLSVIHFLGLTPEQRSQMKEILSPVREEAEKAKTQGEKWNREVMEPRLRKVVSDLKNGRKPEPPSEGTVTKFEQFQQTMRDYRIQARSTMERVLNVLTPEQREKLRSFHPQEYIGLMPSPPPGPLGRDPLEVIDEIRTMPPEEFNALLERLQSRGKRGGKKAPDRAKRIQALINFMKEVRNMSEKEFAGQSEQLQERYDQLRPQYPQGPEKGMKGKGPKGRKGKGPKGMEGKGPHGNGPKGDGFIIKHIILSEAFYQAL